MLILSNSVFSERINNYDRIQTTTTMANWISSKLRVAETFLQQIDQQAADSLGKNERPRSDEPSSDSTSKNGGVVPLKDQLKKKTQENYDYQGKLGRDPNHNLPSNREISKDAANSLPSEHPSIHKSSLTDSDWTQLLSSPNQSTSPSTNRSNGVSAMRGMRKDSRRNGNLGSHLLNMEPKKTQRSNTNVLKATRRSDIAPENKVTGVILDGDLSNVKSMQRASILEPGHDNKDERDLVQVSGSAKLMVNQMDEVDQGNNGVRNTLGDGRSSVSDDVPRKDASQSVNRKRVPEVSVKLGISPGDGNKSRSMAVGVDEYNAASGNLVSERLKRSSSITDEEADSDTAGSASTSDSESEGEREEKKRRREQILAERAAAKAVEAIKERENMVAKLEGEKQSLEKILEERAKQQAQEASELQATMMETMEAVELEKQKHNNTRMEALTRLARLETSNADLARSLATAQWNLEVEVNRVAELRQQIELKKIVHEEIKRISNVNKTGTSLNQVIASKGEEFEREILEAEYSFVTDKIGCLQDKAKKLEANIKMTRNEIEHPTELEVEFKRRLGQLTDHLIQKQTQVEALSSEKATLLFRIEALSRLLDDNKAMLNMAESRVDIESGTWGLSNSKFKHSFGDKVRTSQLHLGSLIRQLDTLFSAGSVFLRRNPTARWWSLIYVLCLHLWVVYILMSHSQTSNDFRTGAVVSLENINNTAGV